MENQEWEPSRYDSEEREKKLKERINQALQEMEDEGLIRYSVDAGNLIYVIYVKETYKVCYFPVATKYRTDGRREKHPQKVAISVNLYETLESIKRKILRTIEAKERGWLLKRF